VVLKIKEGKENLQLGSTRDQKLLTKETSCSFQAIEKE